MSDVNVDELRQKVATSCRILAMMGLVNEIHGHVSARLPRSEVMLLRCRNIADEQGLDFTVMEDIRKVDFNGQGIDLNDEFVINNEVSIHGEIYKHRPEVGCVVHAHPYASLLCGLGNVKLAPVVGAYDPLTMNIALEGIPVFENSYALTNASMMQSVLEVMGDKKNILLKGHGVIVVGKTVEEATIRAIKFERLANICWSLAAAGKEVVSIPPEDIQHTKALQTTVDSPKINRLNSIWNYYIRLLENKAPHIEIK